MDFLKSLREEIDKKRELDIDYLMSLDGPERAAILRANPKARELYRQMEIQSTKRSQK